MIDQDRLNQASCEAGKLDDEVIATHQGVELLRLNIALLTPDKKNRLEVV